MASQNLGNSIDFFYDTLRVLRLFFFFYDFDYNVATSKSIVNKTGTCFRLIYVSIVAVLISDWFKISQLEAKHREYSDKRIKKYKSTPSRLLTLNRDRSRKNVSDIIHDSPTTHVRIYTLLDFLINRLEHCLYFHFYYWLWLFNFITQLQTFCL